MTGKGGDKEGETGRGERQGGGKDREGRKTGEGNRQGGEGETGETDREGRRGDRGDRQGGGTEREGEQTGRGDRQGGRTYIGVGTCCRSSVVASFAVRWQGVVSVGVVLRQGVIVVVRGGRHRHPAWALSYVGRASSSGWALVLRWRSVVICGPRCC